MKKIVIFLLYFITFLVYTQGFLERFTPIPAKLAIEAFVLILTLCAFRPKVGIIWMAAVLIAGLSAALHSNGMIAYIKYIRYFVYFYIIYSVFWNMHFTISEFNRYVKFIVMMVLLQGVASIINLVFYGRQEYNVGAMSSLGGTTATAFPLFIFSVLLVIFYFSSFTKKRWYIYMLLMLASVFLMSYCSGKRAIFYYVPAFFVAITLISFFFIQWKLFRRKALWATVALVCFLPVYFLGITQAAGIGDNLVGNESRMEILKTALEFAEDYEDAEWEGQTMGRSNTTETILNEAVKSKDGWFVGHGFGSIKDEGEVNSEGIIYGFVGFTRDVFSGGIVFASLTALCMLFLILYHDAKPLNPFSKTMRIVLLALFVVIHFTYSPDFTVALKLNMIYLPIICFLNSKNYRHLNDYYMSLLQPN